MHNGNLEMTRKYFRSHNRSQQISQKNNRSQQAWALCKELESVDVHSDLASLDGDI